MTYMRTLRTSNHAPCAYYFTHGGDQAWHSVSIHVNQRLAFSLPQQKHHPTSACNAYCPVPNINYSLFIININ